MEKSRRVKLLFIAVLIIAVCTMALGFAAFSVTLAISSNATVAPNSEDFKLRIYGFQNKNLLEEFVIGLFENDKVDFSLLSNKNSVGINEDNTMSSTLANIDNTTLTISNMNASFSGPGSDVEYLFVIRNEGMYDAYLDVENIYQNDDPPLSYSCDILEDEYATSTIEVCDLIGFHFDFSSSTGEDLENYVIPVDDFIFFAFTIKYGDAYADAPVLVKFENFKLHFTTKPQTYN